ncbi:hypothetical protein QRO11_08295 [Paracidovorax citrulli]|uniref:Uncharacterized protein n=1 Tax=Paracidovorax citrulli TaxID=80869 RepID=A0ABY9AX95_PARCI|nr:hypothetical protein [Paracidovorax citrulli]UEG48480.1 hypothetical protein LKW27_08085 [Paracidovorax citrulli]WIY32583.1 hypothetical protein QRO09_04605 [Paracidovorax citrulli]WIY37032.1 hypothetical protein QRO11_08295 [Paracidovorax citrulli]WIY41822.1 hypothetical protein QRO10_04545 [Paracidovorax citrulli]WIY46622.1 hypothetical protein QRO12_16475 [Paracidovorax citrulli]
MTVTLARKPPAGQRAAAGAMSGTSSGSARCAADRFTDTGRPPERPLRAGLVQYPGADGADEARLLRDRDELARQQFPHHGGLQPGLQGMAKDRCHRAGAGA